MAEVSKLPEDGESVGVNQIRNKVNEIIDEGVGGGGGGNAVIDVGDVGVYSSNLSNNLFIEPAEGANNNGGLRNVSGTYIPNAGTNRIDDFPVHQQKISDSTGINHFAFILNGRLYTATGNEGHGNSASIRGDGDSNSENPGLENIREHNLGGHYQHDTDVEVLDFYIGYSFSAVLTSDGILWGWGRNNTGQLAQGNTTTYNSPVIIDRNVTRMWGPRGVQQHMGTWYDHGALYWQNSWDTYHQIRCAGYNGQGQLADGTTASTGTTAKPFVISSWSHLNDFVSYQVKQVYNFTGVYGFVFIVLQHKNDARVQQVITCGYNGYSNLGIDRYDSHTSAGPSSNPAYSIYPEILPTNTVNVTKWLWCLTAEGIPSWLPSWRCWHDSCAQEILGFYAGYHHSITATTANITPWAVCWSRVWSAYGEVQGDFLRAAGKNNWGMLGCVDKALGTTSHENGQNYKTFKYIPPDTDGYTWDEALAAAPTSESGAKLAAPTTRAEWDRIGVYIAETLSQPNSQDMHHGWLALVDSEAEGWWKNYHTNKQTNRLYLPFSGVQPDDAAGNQHFQGYTEFVYYNPQSVGVRTEDMTEFRYQGSGETDGIRADYYINNSTNKMGRGVHDSICIGRGNTTTNNYVFIADTHCTSTTTPTLKTRIWRSNSTTSKVSFSDVIDENQFSVTTEHPSCYSQNGYKLHYVNPYIGKFVHIEDTGDLLYIAWHHDNNQLICARTHNLGSNWTYHYSTIPGAWGQRTKDEGFHVGGAGTHVDGGCTSAVYLGNGVVVAAFGGASTWSGLGIGENRPSQALLVRSYDYGKTWHMIGDGDVAWTFSNLTPVGNYATHFTVGRYYDTISNKFRLICSACSGGVVGNGNYLSSGGFTWSINSDVFALAYSDDYGETWNWCEIDGAQINYNLMDITLWPNKDIFRGEMMHFIDQQSKVFIVRTHWEKAEEGNIHGETRANWDVKTNAWCYVSGNGGRTFESTPPGYLTNLTDYDAGIIQENGVYNKAGADLNNTGVPVQATNMGKSYRSVIKLEAYGTDGVVVFWGRNSDQQYQAPGYGDSSTFDNNTVEVANYKSLPIAGGDGIFEDWLLQDSNLANLETFSNKWNTTPKIKDFIGQATSYSMSDNGQRMILGFQDSIIPSIHRDPYVFTTYENKMPAGVAIILQKNTSGGWTVMPTRVPNYHSDGISTGTNRYCLYANLEEYKQFIGDVGAGVYEESTWYYRFGFDVSMSGDGNTVAISAPGHGPYDNIRGTIYTYQWNGSRWVGNRTNSMNSHYIGQQVKLNYDGTRLVSSVCGRANATQFSSFSNENYQAAQVCIADTNFWEWKQEANIANDYDNWGNTSISTSHDSDTSQKMQYIAVGGFPEEFSWNPGHVSQGPVIYTGGWKHIYDFFHEPYTALDYDGEGDAITILKSWTVSEYTAKDFNQYGGETHRAPMNFIPPGWTEQSLYDFAQEFMADASHPDTGEIQSLDFMYLNTTRYHGFIRDSMNFAVNSYNGKIYDYTWEGMPPTTSGNNNVLETRFGSFLELNSTGDVMLVGAPLYRVINGDTPSRLITSTNLNKRLGAVYMFKWDSQWGREDVEIFYESSYGTYRSTSPMIGNWVNVMGDGGPLYVGDDLAGAYAGNNFGYRQLASWIGVWDNQNSMEQPPLNYSEPDRKRTPGWRKTFQFSNNGQKISIIDGHAEKVQMFTYDYNTNTVTKEGAINVASASGGASEPNGMGVDLKYGILEPNGQFMHTSLYATREGTTDYTAATFDTNLAEFAEPWQPEHRITAIYDIMTPGTVRNGPNVADYFMGPYHYSWGNNATYKQLFNQGSHLTGSYLPTGDLSFMQGGYGNLNSGNTIFAYAKKFPGAWLGFTDGENYAHIMAGSFVGYDGWRDLSSANKVSGNNFIFQAGGALYPQLNDIGGPSTTRSWGDYNGSTRYYGFWIEKEYAAADDNGTLTLGRDGLNRNPCISIAIPEINRFTSPNSCTEYTNLVQDPVVQIRDIRQYASGPGGLIITLSNGNAWSIGYNSLGQRCAADYLNLATTTTGYDFPTKIIYPNKQNNSQGWDNCLIATSSWATYDHHNSIIMRDKQGSAWGWGDNNVGELGLGHQASQHGPPEKIPLPKGVVPSVMGCAGSGSRGPVGIMITDDGRMFAAGYNGNNLVANGEGAVSNFRLYIPIRNPLA